MTEENSIEENSEVRASDSGLDDSESDGSELVDSELVDSESDGSESDGSESDGSESDGSELIDSGSDDPESDAADPESDEDVVFQDDFEATPVVTAAAGSESDEDFNVRDGQEEQNDQQARSKFLRSGFFSRRGVFMFLVAMLLALFVRAFVLQAFYIPSGSMIPTLQIDDRVLVEKISYRFRDVRRGDVVVFHKPEPGYEISDLIKRVIAVGGDRFELQDGKVYVNNEPLDEPYLEADTMTRMKGLIPGCGNIPVENLCEVPEGMLLVLGDNREGSRDSRVYGPVDADTVIGRAIVRILPISRISFI